MHAKPKVSLFLGVAYRSDAETPATSPAPSPPAAMLVTTLTTDYSEAVSQPQLKGFLLIRVACGHGASS